MQPEQTIQPLNVAAATLLVQLLFMTLLAIASSLYDSQRSVIGVRRMRGEEGDAGPPLRKTPTLFLALLSFAILLVSDELYSIWSPIFQGVGINTMSAATAIALVFYLDIALVGFLIACSGGSGSSPFVPALFTLPALAIFLRLPPSLFLAFTVVAALVYFLMLTQPFAREASGQSAAAFMNIACLCLSIFTGYITRPVSIGELKLPTARAQGATPATSSIPPTPSASEPR